MNSKMKIKEVIVVEGKDDTKRIKMAVEADTFETSGSAIDSQKLTQIAALQAKRGVIVFTDPDFSGEKIRKTIQQAVPGVKHAFLRRKDAAPKYHGSLGVEHASVTAIRDALKNLYTPDPTAPILITHELLNSYGLTNGKDARYKRKLLGEILNIGYTNGKQLYKRLRMFQITPLELKRAIQKVTNQLERGSK